MDIERTLNEAPGTMGRISAETEEQRLIYSRMKEELKRVEARVYLGFKAEDSESTVNELNAKVTNDNEVYIARLEIVEQESTYRKKECEFKTWEEALNASKIIAKMRMAEMKLG